MRPCSKCGKPHSGKRPRCKECETERARIYRANPAVKEREKERQRGYDRARRADPDRVEYQRNWIRAYLETPAGKENRRKWRSAPRVRVRNRELGRKHEAAYRATPAARAARSRRRKFLKQAEVEQFTDIEIFERDGWRCHICRKQVRRTLKFPNPMSASLDHIVPVSKGGSHTRDNVACAHYRCNLAKRASMRGGVQPLLVG